MGGIPQSRETVEDDRLADDVRIAVERALPKPVAQYDDGGFARHVFVGQQEPAVRLKVRRAYRMSCRKSVIAQVDVWVSVTDSTYARERLSSNAGDYRLRRNGILHGVTNTGP